MPKTRSQTIDAVKGAAILLVMFGHVEVWNSMEDGYVYDVIKVIQMPLFIMVSGYLCGIGRHVEDLRGYGRMLGKKALTYLVPFFFWIVLLHPTTPVSSVVDVLFCLDRGLWFLMTLFILTFMLYTAELAGSLAGRHGRIAFWVVYLVLAAFVVLETVLGWEFLSPGLTRLYLPFFLLGYLVGEYRERADLIPSPVKNAAGAVSLAGLLLLAIFTDLQNVDTVFNLGRQLFASLLGCYAVIWLISLLRDGRVKSFFAWLGRYTLEIYVLHFHFATVLNQGKVYSLFTWEGLGFALASFAVMSLITAVIIVITRKFRILNFLMYGKLPQNRK